MSNDLPPSDQFARYLVSPYHARRMEIARARMLQRMNNFVDTEVYAAISEALGAITALAEFYSPYRTKERSLTSIIAGDPAPNRPHFEEPEPDAPVTAVVHPYRPKLSISEKKMLRAMSDGKPRTREQLIVEIDSSAKKPETMNGKISILRAKIKSAGISIETDEGPSYYIPAPCCAKARELAGGAA